MVIFHDFSWGHISLRYLKWIKGVCVIPQDIKELNLTDNPAWEGERRNTKGDRYEDMHCAMFICPVVGLEMNGKHRYVAMVCTNEYDYIQASRQCLCILSMSFNDKRGVGHFHPEVSSHFDEFLHWIMCINLQPECQPVCAIILTLSQTDLGPGYVQ